MAGRKEGRVGSALYFGELLQSRKVLQILETEVFEEQGRGFIQQRVPRIVLASGGSDQLAFEQGGEHPGLFDTPDGLNLAGGNRLFIRNDRLTSGGRAGKGKHAAVDPVGPL